MKNTLLIAAWRPIAYLSILAIFCTTACRKDSNAIDNAKPVAIIAGNDTMLVLPVSGFTLDGSSSYDPGGGELSFYWQLITTAQGASIKDHTSKTTTLEMTGLGKYTVVLTVSNRGKKATDTLAITVVSDPPPNQPPVARAGPGEFLDFIFGKTYPLNGYRSFDPDGSIVASKWRQLSGPSVLLLAPDSLLCPIGPYNTGIYIFALQVWDNFGLSGEDTVSVSFTLGNGTQSGNNFSITAGPDQTITLPLDTMYFDTRFVHDGNIYPAARQLDIFLWTQLSGPRKVLPQEASMPGSAIIQGQSFFSKKMVAGTYSFRLQVHAGTNVAADTIVVTVVNNTAEPNTVTYTLPWQNGSSFPDAFCPVTGFHVRPDMLNGMGRMQYQLHNSPAWQSLTTNPSSEVRYEDWGSNGILVAADCDSSLMNKTVSIKLFR